MTIEAKVILDSVSPGGVRLTTLQLRYPRFIHAEFMTHRMFSRNASSSRAVPVKKLIEDVIRDTAMPIHWGKNQPGMQAREEHNFLVEVMKPEEDWFSEVTADTAWQVARDLAIGLAEAYDAAGYHKQIVNRLLEPFSHINVVCTATEWDNFFALRLHPDAQPEIQKLAECMKNVMDLSLPISRSVHLPYLTESELINRNAIGFDNLYSLSAARCARVSFLTYEGKEPDIVKDLELASKLKDRDDPHWSPWEHAAKASTAMPSAMFFNLRGWKSRRYQLEP